MGTLVKLIPCLLLATAVIPADAAAPIEAGPLHVNGALPPPPGFDQASACVAHEGIHYLRGREKTLSPILAYDESGRLVSLEYIVSLKDLESGGSWTGLPGVAGRSVDHIDIDFYPAGRRGNPVPYYSVHLYFIDATEQQRICPSSTATEPVGRVIEQQ